MMRRRLILIAAALTLLLSLSIPAAAKEITLRGRLARTVESGGWLLLADTNKKSDKYLLLNASSFQKNTWFRVGALVEVTGEVKDDVMTIYQEGTPFEARTMRPINTAKKPAWRRRKPAR